MLEAVVASVEGVVEALASDFVDSAVFLFI